VLSPHPHNLYSPVGLVFIQLLPGLALLIEELGVIPVLKAIATSLPGYDLTNLPIL
jgi:hypothetical protein